MFELFKRKETKEIESTPAVKPTVSKEYSKDILELHHSFQTASDKALAEAQEILAECEKKDIDKGKRLSKLGFSSTSQAKESSEIESKSEKAKAVSKTILELRQKYPLYKCISEDSAKKLCKKYGLVMGNIDRFQGFVPEKNLSEIENFMENNPINDEDKVYYWMSYIGGGRHYCDFEEYKTHTKNGISTGSFRYECDTTLRICAPIKDMDTRGMDVKDGWKLTAKPVEDPVVMYPLRDNMYMIITAWGDEASDPIVVNENMN